MVLAAMAVVAPETAHAYTPDRAVVVLPTHTRLVSVAADGGPADGPSDSPSISSDGRTIAYESTATNLVPGDDDGVSDIFVRDRSTGSNVLVSAASSASNAVRWADGASRSPAISGSGRYVAFVSDADNLVPGDTDGVSDVFVRDLKTHTTRLVSQPPGGGVSNGASQGPLSITAGGRYVAFVSDATNLAGGAAGAFVADLVAGTITLLAAPACPSDAFPTPSYSPTISASGGSVVFGQCETGAGVWWQQSGPAGSPSLLVEGEFHGDDYFDWALSGDGTTAADEHLVGYDPPKTSVEARRPFGTVTANFGCDSGGPESLDLTGDHVAFVGAHFVQTCNEGFGLLTLGPREIDVADWTGARRLATASWYGGAANGDSNNPSLDRSGDDVAYDSSASNLVTDDTNGMRDVFVTDLTGVHDIACTVAGTPEADTLIGTPGDDVICGFAGDDIIDGGGGRDVLLGGAGNDLLIERDGVVEMGGGSGIDTLSFVNASGPVTLDLRAGSTDSMIVSGVESIVGSRFDDTMVGSTGNDTLDGRAGNDSLYGSGGADFLVGGPGDDHLYGDGDGFGIVQGQPGPDAMDGGTGTDTCDHGGDLTDPPARRCEG